MEPNYEDAGQIPYMNDDLQMAQLEAAAMDQAKWLILATSLRIAAKAIDDCKRKPTPKVAKTIFNFIHGQIAKFDNLT